MRTRALWLLGALGCAQPVLTTREVPPPGVSMPYGLLAVDVELGDTRGARLQVKATGYVDREIPLPSDGVYVLKMQPAEWTVQVLGVAGKADVVTFGGTETQGEASGKTAAFPPTAVEIVVEKNRLSNAGHICAHRTCKEPWRPYDHPAFSDWQQLRRYEEATPPAPPEAPEPKE